MNKRKIFRFLLLLLLPLAAACTKEDYRNCPAGLYITFEANNPKHVYPEKVQRVYLFFYDGKGDLAAEFRYERDDLRATDRAAFVPQLPTGTYRVVAVVNGGVFTRTQDIEKYSTLHTMLVEEELNYKPVDFFTAEKEITVAVNTTSVIPTEKMMLAKHNNDIHLNIVYDGYVLPAGSDLDAFVCGNNRRFEYVSYACPTSSFVRYLAWSRRTNIANSLPDGFSFTTMRLWHGGDICLHLEEVPTRSGRSIVLNIADELAKVRDDKGNPLYDTDDKLEYHDEYEITVRLGKDFVVLSITIDKWDTIGGGVEV